MFTFARRIIFLRQVTKVIITLIVLCSISAHAQTTRRLKVYIKIESPKNEWKITECVNNFETLR